MSDKRRYPDPPPPNEPKGSRSPRPGIQGGRHLGGVFKKAKITLPKPHTPLKGGTCVASWWCIQAASSRRVHCRKFEDRQHKQRRKTSVQEIGGYYVTENDRESTAEQRWRNEPRRREDRWGQITVRRRNGKAEGTSAKRIHRHPFPRSKPKNSTLVGQRPVPPGGSVCRAPLPVGSTI